MSHHYVFDYVAELYWLGKISEDAAVTYLQTEADLQTYQLMLSRDQNFRPGDTTSVFSNSSPFRYLSRLFSKEGDAVVHRIEQQKPWLHEAPHDGLRKAQLYFEAFGSRLRIVHIVRDPIDLIADLIRRGFGWRIGNDPREFQLNIQKSQGPIPISLKDLDFDLVGLSDSDLAALLVQESMRHNLDGFSRLNAKDQKKVKLVFFDDFCKDPFEIVSQVSEFLGVNMTRKTSRAIRNESLPRQLPNRTLERDSLASQMTDIGESAMNQAEKIYSRYQAEAA